MDNKRLTIGVVTGARSDYGLLCWVMRAIAADRELALTTYVTGMHLSPEFGATVQAIEADGFVIDERVEMLLSSDSPVGIAKSLGLGVIGFADALARKRPDWLLVLGDRFETLAAVEAAMIARIPVAHIAGGDLTEGVMDDAFRHAITKMAQVHFVTNSEAARRVAQLGEAPERIHVVGSPGLDGIHHIDRMSREQLAASLGIAWRRRNLLVTFHPVALADVGPEAQFDELLQALTTLGDDVSFVFTHPNADTAGRALIPMLEAFVAAHRERACSVASLGQRRYLSALSMVDAMVGNSSSGLYEAPSFKIPTVNIGDRQRGRLRAASVLDCPAEREAIRATISRAFALDCTRVVNPYGDGQASPRIVDQLKKTPVTLELFTKRFVDWARPAEV